MKDLKLPPLRMAIFLHGLLILAVAIPIVADTSPPALPALGPDESEKIDAEESQSRIVLDNAVFDAGIVSRGDKITHAFTFSNTGTSDLVILNTKAG